MWRLCEKKRRKTQKNAMWIPCENQNCRLSESKKLEHADFGTYGFDFDTFRIDFGTLSEELIHLIKDLII